MKVYVATKFEHKKELAEIIARVKAAGHTITYNWGVHSETMDYPEGPERDAEQRRQAVLDVKGVHDADVVLFVPAAGSKGGWFEAGMQCAFNFMIGNCHTIVVGDPQGPGGECVFEYLPPEYNIHRVATVDEALGLMVRIALPDPNVDFEPAQLSLFEMKCAKCGNPGAAAVGENGAVECSSCYYSKEKKA